MDTSAPQIYLASASPRRRALLEQIGIRYRVVPVTVDEAWDGQETPQAHVLRLALAKAQAGARQRGSGAHLPVLGADTAVVLGREVLGKPESKEHALTMLERLSGRTHEVLTAVALVGERQAARQSRSLVTFHAATAAQRAAYWASGEPRDKAGAYAIQGRAAAFISHLEGSYSGVMGLPLFETAELLDEFGIEVFSTALLP